MDKAVLFSLRSPCRMLSLAIVLLLSAWPNHAHAQADSTAQIYKDIHEYSLKNKLTRWIYCGIFVEPKAAVEPHASAPRTERVNPFLTDLGKIILHNAVRTMDTFGFSVDDTTRLPVNTLQTRGNGLHRKTRPRLVKIPLLVESRQQVDPLRMSESER